MPQSFIYLLYRAALAVAFPFLLLYVLVRGLRDRRYFQHGRERWGFLPHSFQRTAQQTIWLHAVSVGEVLSAITLIQRLRKRHPEAPVFVSCMTVTGREVAEERLRGLVDGIFYLPWDYVSGVRRVLRHIRPAVTVIMETEIWPNLYREVKRSGAALLIVNGRISVKAYPSYQRWRTLVSAALAWPDEILAQSERDARYYRQLGTPADRVKNSGNLKYDFAPPGSPPPGLLDWLKQSGDGPLWIAASTTPAVVAGDPDEDSLVLDTYEQLRTEFAGLRLVIAPRQQSRFDETATLLSARGTPFARRTGLPSQARVLLLDSIGELSSLYPHATVVFVGGSLVRRGGHNILEPALCGVPVMVGPHMENFQEIFARFEAAEAVATVTANNLTSTLRKLLCEDRTRVELAARALRTADEQRGAAERAVASISRLLSSVIPRRVFPGAWLLRPLTPLWRWGASRRRRHLTGQQEWLSAPVISVGNVTAGGTGKTPFVVWLCEWLTRQGLRPAVLTRGYQREANRDVYVPCRGSAPVEDVGDEALTILRAGHAALGVGADRVKTGRATLAAGLGNVLVLDDGFQHARLARDLDIVLIDALDPFGGGDLFPAGRLREPPDALHRADLIVITRAPRTWEVTGLRESIRHHNATAPIFSSRVAPADWIALSTGQPAHLPVEGEPVALCGLANPESFWQSLRDLEIQTLKNVSFPDHYRYVESDLQTLAESGAAYLLTTEKDAVKIAGFLCRIPVYWLQIGLSFDNQGELENSLLSLLQMPKSTVQR